MLQNSIAYAVIKMIIILFFQSHEGVFQGAKIRDLKAFFKDKDKDRLSSLKAFCENRRHNER